MAKYKALKEYYSESQKRVLEEGEVFEITDEMMVEALDESVKKHGSGFLEKLPEKKSAKSTKAKAEEVKGVEVNE